MTFAAAPRPAVGVLLVLALAGCASPPPPPVAADPAEMRIAEAAIRAERSLAALAQARRVPAGPAAAPAPRIVPPELLARRDLDWHGPLETLAARLADEAGYAFVAAGRAPPVPVMVRIEARNRPLILLLRDAGAQAGEAALLTVDAERSTVRLDWIPPAPAVRPAPGGRG